MLGSNAALLIPCFFLGMILLGWGSSSSLEKPSIKSLEDQLTSLRRELQGFEKLKEQVVRDEIEISWDKQHLAELKDRRAKLGSTMVHMSKSFDKGAARKRGNNRNMGRALSAMHAYNDKVREQDMQVIHQLEEESEIAQQKKFEEHAENVLLNDVLGEIRDLLETQISNTVTREGLRGASQ